MLNLDSRSKTKLVWVVTLLTPVLAVQGVRTVFGVSATPSGASAAVIGPLPATLGTPAADLEKLLTPVQTKAKAWAMSRTRTLQPRSPMDRADPIPSADPDRPPSVVVTSRASPTASPDTAPPAMTLSAMVAGGKDGHPVVLINHRACRIGDSVSPLWKIIRIDTRNRLVILEGPDDRTIELRPPTPSQTRDDLEPMLPSTPEPEKKTTPQSRAPGR